MSYRIAERVSRRRPFFMSATNQMSNRTIQRMGDQVASSGTMLWSHSLPSPTQ